MQVCVITFCQDNGIALTMKLKRGEVVELALNRDISQLDCSSFDHVILSGFFPSVVCREFEISSQIGKKELTHTLLYKFAYNLPLDPSEVWWWYRISHSRGPDQAHKICAASIDKSEFAKLMNLLEQNNARIDQCIMSQLLVSSDLFPKFGKYGHPTEENLVRYIQETQSEQYDNFIQKLDPDIPDSCKLTFFAMFTFVKTPGALKSAFPGSEIIPLGRSPVRYKLLRSINCILMIFGLIFAAVVLIDRCSRSFAKYEAVEQQNNVLREELKELQTHNLQLAQKEKLLQEYKDLKAGYAGLENVLLEITRLLPDYMWVKSLRLFNNSLVMTIESSKDDINFYTTIKNGKLYELRNLRKNKSRGNNFDYSVTLELMEK